MSFFSVCRRSFWIQAKLAKHQQGPTCQNNAKSMCNIDFLNLSNNQNAEKIGRTIKMHYSPRKNVQVIAVDARNHGESPHSLEHRYADLAEDIHQFYEEHKISKAVVIGHSMGGRAMMAFALKYVSEFSYCSHQRKPSCYNYNDQKAFTSYLSIHYRFHAATTCRESHNCRCVAGNNFAGSIQHGRNILGHATRSFCAWHRSSPSPGVGRQTTSAIDSRTGDP